MRHREIVMRLKPGEKIDWFRVIVDLCDLHGYTVLTIAVAVQAAKSTVQGWKQGAAPKYEDGERLLELWEMVTRESRETVPKNNLH